jgi:thioesterase domain-containing protein/acyl carrier protein
VAIDYWRRPELTRERFLPELAAEPGTVRWYRTGDRVRWGPGGRLEHHGRLDHQVKLRGHRIELGEIEAVLRRQSGIRDAVVLLREDRAREQRLAAYLVVEPGTEPDPAELRAALREELPSYMLPSAYVALERFPMTPNNKIDRRALPAPERPAAEAIAEPRDALEIQIARIWSDLLGIERVGIHDSFWDLGGHSVLAVQLMTAIRREWDLALPVSELLQHPTIADLAARIRSGAPAVSGSPLVPLRAGDPEVPPLLLFHPFGGNVFCYLELVRQLAPGRPVVAVQAPGLETAEASEVAVPAMARHYLDELRRVQPEGPYLLGGWCFGGVIAYEAARQLLAASERLAGLVLIDTRAPIAENIPADADDATLLSWFVRDLGVPFGKAIDLAPDALRALAPEAMFEHALASARQAGVVPEDADMDQIHRYFEVYIANGIALQTYLPGPAALDGLLLRARDEAADYGPALGWDRLLGSGLTVVDVPGDHNTVMFAPNAAAVAAAIDGRMPARVIETLEVVG